MPYEKKELSSQTMAGTNTPSSRSIYSNNDEDLKRTAEEHHLSSIFPIAVPRSRDNTSNMLKDDIYLTSFRKSKKSLRSSNRSSLYSPKSCPICLEEYKIDDEIAWSRNQDCLHAFHLDCISDWLMDNDDCPLCRADYLKIKENC